MKYIKSLNTSFFEETNLSLRSSSILNSFNMLQDYNNDKYMNIFRNFILTDDIMSNDENFYIYQIENTDTWDGISWKCYRTPYLWWIIANINNISNPFEDLIEGSELKILNKSLLFDYFESINALAEK